MSRAAFFDALAQDEWLNSIGVKDDPDMPTLCQNYSSEERPSNGKPFVILRWNGQARPPWQDPDAPTKSPDTVTVWAHWPKELSNDYNDVIKILDRVDDIVRLLRDVNGSDGYTLNFVTIGSRSGDFLDNGFNTISKNANYEVHTRRTNV
jgi:hypothetical protein